MPYRSKEVFWKGGSQHPVSHVAMGRRSKRRFFRWPAEARQQVRDYRNLVRRTQDHSDGTRRQLVTRLVEISGNPRDACVRFILQFGVTGKRRCRPWTRPEQQKLLDLITTVPVKEAAKILGRPSGSVRSMLHRLGIGVRAGRDWLTKHSLSRALHIRSDEVQKWIDRGWLKSRPVDADGLRFHVIDAEMFCDFVKQHAHEAASRRLSYEALWFMKNYVFPANHSPLLALRGTYNKGTADSEDKEDESFSKSA
jgi:hypothetical protein